MRIRILKFILMLQMALSPSCFKWPSAPHASNGPQPLMLQMAFSPSCFKWPSAPHASKVGCSFSDE